MKKHNIMYRLLQQLASGFIDVKKYIYTSWHTHGHTHTHTKPHLGTSASVCIQKHLRTKPPEVSTFLDGKQAWELLSHAGQASGITSAHNMNPHTHKRTHTLTGL